MPDRDAEKPQKQWRGRRWIGGALLVILRAVGWIQSGLAVAEMPNDWESTKLVVGKVAGAVDFGPMDAVVIAGALGIAFGPEIWRWGRRSLAARFSRLPPEPEPAPTPIPVEPASPESEAESASRPAREPPPPPEPEPMVDVDVDVESSELSWHGGRTWGLWLQIRVRCVKNECAFIRSVNLESDYGKWRLSGGYEDAPGMLNLHKKFKPGEEVKGLLAYECLDADTEDSIFDHPFVLVVKVAGEPDYEFQFQPVRSDSPGATAYRIKKV